MQDPQRPNFMPQTVDQNGKTVGARVPPSFCAKCCAPPCAISGYETGDPTLGICQGKALAALILEILCCMGCVVSLCCWAPDPENIKGDGTQRTVEQKCLAGCCLGFWAIAFWENGDFCCTPDCTCTWFTEQTLPGCGAHWGPPCFGLPPLDCCYVCCVWKPQSQFFRRDLTNHGGGKNPGVVGLPVQTAPGNLTLFAVSQAVAPQVVGQVVQAQLAYGGNIYGSNRDTE